MNLVLYHYWRSSCSYRVRFGLAYKKLAYESRTVNLLAHEQIAPAHVARSPMGRVPCLVVDGRPLTESLAILEYIDEVVPGRPLLPRDPWDRARVRQISEMINSGIQPLHNSGVLSLISSDAGEQAAWARTSIERGLAGLERALSVAAIERGGEGRYAVGDALSMADVCLVPQVYQARRFGVALDAFPRTAAIHAACMELEEAQSSAPERQADAPESVRSPSR